MKTILTKVSAFLMALFLLSSVGYSEIVTTAGTVTVCPGTNNVAVPITVTGFSGVATISLTLNYNGANLTYLSYVANPALAASGGFTMVGNPGDPPNQIKAAYFSLGLPLNLADGSTLFTFYFNVSGPSLLTWDLVTQGGCQYSDYDTQTIPASWVNGEIITDLDATITSPIAVCEGSPAPVTIDFTSGVGPFTVVYNDGVNPDVTVTTSSDPYVFDENITATTTWTLVSITSSLGCSETLNYTTTTDYLPAPVIFNVSGGGLFCEGGSAEVFLDGSETGVIYALYLDGQNTGYSLEGTGSSLTFSGLTDPGTYTVVVTSDCGEILMNGDATINVNPLPEVTLEPFNPVCVYAEAFVLTGGSPEGGEYSGIGVADGMFYPNLLDPGTYLITYSYTDNNGCSNSASEEIIVVALPLLYVEPILPLCIDVSGVDLVAIPAGGIFSGPGVVENTFFPGTAGPGISTIVYDYVDDYGCANSTSIDVEVFDLPVVTLDPLGSLCADAMGITMNGQPQGGAYSGPGVVGDMFEATMTGPGTFTITYTYTDAVGCSGSASQDVVVYELPLVTIDPAGPFCQNDDPVILNGSPQGGFFSGSGVTPDGLFNPADLGSGTWSVAYTFVDGNGCSSYAMTDITINELPIVYIEPVAPICYGPELVDLVGYPEGGTFAGPGVVGNQFDPLQVQPGITTISYTYTDNNGCTNIASLDIEVNAIPFVYFDPVSPTCENSAPVLLTGLPEGGEFFGNGVSGNYFYPDVAGAGTHFLSYVYTNEFGCSNFAEATAVVNALTPVSIDPVGPLCIDGSPVQLAGYPEGGVFSGPGVDNGFFDPALAGEGVFTISYYFLNTENCLSFATIDITVNPLPYVAIDPLAPVCYGPDVVILTAYPEGGVFSGDGVIGNEFHPLMVEVGDYIISYTYTDENGCSNTASTSITVNPVPSPFFEYVEASCVNGNPVELIGVPEGGEFTGTGVSGNYFYPDVAGVGTHTLAYTYTNEFGCSNFYMRMAEVYPLTEVVIDPVGPFCIDGEAMTLTASPLGGVFAGPGVDNGVFYPSISGEGTWTVTYYYINENNCLTEASIDIVVNPLPYVSIDPVGPVCYGPGVYPLTGYPEGGIFSGPGVMGSDFDAIMLEAGVYTITYTYTDENGCSNTASTDVTVNPVPYPFLYPIDPVCVNAGPVELMGAPEGGYYTGVGVSGNQFYPEIAGVGSTAVAYVYTNEFGCSNYYERNILVNPAPEIIIQAVADLCVTGNPVELFATPEGGVFSGPGVIGNIFYPNEAGVGTFEIIYSFTNEFGCFGTGTQLINVIPSINVVFNPLPDVCISTEMVILTAFPAGGYFEGPGVVEDIFYPGMVGVGTYTITYYYSDPSGCQGSASQDITVLPLPQVAFTAIGEVCLDSQPVVLQAAPEGGWFSGNGVVGNSFYPYQAGLGEAVITYTYVDENGCEGSASVTINVLPAAEFTDQPVDVTVLDGQAATFTVAATGAVSYSWQYSTDGGNSWADLNIFTETLTIDPATLAMDGYAYHCIIFSACGDAQTSFTAYLHVNPAFISIYAGSAQGCEGQFVIPVLVENFYDVASISLTLNYDASVLTYTGYQNPNPVLYDGMFQINAIESQVKMGFFSVTPANIGDGTLFEILFDGIAGVSPLTWDLSILGNCELMNLDDQPISTQYFNGEVTVFAFPVAYQVTGGGTYCYNGDGMEVGLDGSETGVTYHLLYNGNMINSYEGTGAPLSFGIFTDAGTYTVHAVNDLTGCAAEMNGQADVAMNTQVIADAGPDGLIYQGAYIMLMGGASGGTGNYSYEWSPAASLDNPYVAGPNANPMVSTTYTLVVTDDLGCTASDEVYVEVNVPIDNLSGRVAYLNSLNTPMAFIDVFLMNNSGDVVASTTTNANGEYLFTSLPEGTYTLGAATTTAWGGGNSTDALMMLKHFTGSNILTGLFETVGDVSGNHKITSLDALLTIRRFVGITNTFAPVPDWAFEHPTVTISYGSSVAPVVDFGALCYSDVNGSYIPGLRMAPAVDMQVSGTLAVESNQVVIPVSAAENMTIGSISLVLDLPQNMTVTSITGNFNSDELLSYQSGNQLRIGWCSLEPLNVKSSEVVFYLHANILGSLSEETISIADESLLSDDLANTIDNARLQIPKLVGSSLSLGLNNYPNPFSQTTQIAYTLPSQGTVTLKVYNLIGEQVTELVNASEDAGNYQVTFDASDLTQGVYLLKLEVNDQVITRMMTLNK